MKVKRDDTEEARRYWEFLEENHKIVMAWPEWKRGARGDTSEGEATNMNKPANDVNICLYADDRTSETVEIVEYLLKEKVSFSLIPTTGTVPRLQVGNVHYDGLEGIKIFVGRMNHEEFLKWIEYLPALTDKELASCLAHMVNEAKKRKENK